MSTCGIHIITTTYGTWLPGDQRGHWSPLFDVYGKLRRKGHQLNLADQVTRQRAESNMNEPAKTLNESEQYAVADVIKSFCEIQNSNQSQKHQPRWQIAGWPKPLTVHALAVESNHMHILLRSFEPDIGEVAGRIKSNTASKVLKVGFNVGRSRVWTAGYWKVFLFDIESMGLVQHYIQEHNVRRGFSRKRFDFVQPI